MGKWSGLRNSVPAAPVDEGWQGKVNAAKSKFNDLSTQEKALEYCNLRDVKDSLESQISEVNVKLEALTQMAIHEMEDALMEKMTLSSGDSIAIKDEPYCSVEDKELFITWIRSTNQEDLLSVHYMTLSSLTKDRLQNGEPAPPGIKVFLKQSLTRYKPRAQR